MFKEVFPFERELKITQAYKENMDNDKALREYACLKEQIPTMFKGITKDKDLFCGRLDQPLLGFFPLLVGSKTIDKAGYCINEEACLNKLDELKKSGAYSEEYIKSVEEMIEFWSHECTTEKTKLRFTPEMEKSLVGDDYNTEVGVLYPLYRIAGAHPDLDKLLKNGLSGMQELIKKELEKSDKEKVPLFEGMIGVFGILREVCDMYAKEADRLFEETYDEDRRAELRLMKNSLNNIKDNAPKTLHEAIQLVIIYMMASNTREIGRLDDYLCEFYANDQEEYAKSENYYQSREFSVRMVVSFFDMIEEEFTRDTRAIIGGFGRHDEKKADEFALVVLDALDERPFSFQPQVSLRYYKAMDQRLYDRSINILGKGRTFPILYNDDVNVESVMQAMNVSREDAEQYAFFGCGEYMLAKKSIGTPNILINVAKALEVTLHNGIDPMTEKNCGLQTGEMTDDMSFEDLIDRFKKQILYFADVAGSFKELMYKVCGEEASFLYLSALYDDCIGRGKALFDGGIYHLGGTVETYGNITAADSLTAIKEIVFDQKKFTITELVKMLDCNFEGYEDERQMLINADKFGNDYEDADKISVFLHETVCNAIRNQKDRTNLDSLLVVVINNNMNIAMGRCTMATADGRLAYEPLSNANGAYNGRDKEGITALMKSMTKLDTHIHAGANQNFKFSPMMFKDDAKLAKGLLNGFFSLGGQQTNISVVNQKDLEDAMVHPEKHENLLVRVGGYTARFVQLDKKTQLDVLQRTAY